ncbi:MAG: hypothetical protein IKJ27_04835 [Clostridia bacterium]|nr:hypothetical protein [Clostridia bacterium]
MKKILSVILAVMMLFGAVSVSASASKFNDNYHQNGWANDDQAVLIFDSLNGGTFMNAVYERDENGVWVTTSGKTGVYVMLPQTDEAHTAGSVIILPDVMPNSGSAFKGWHYTDAAGNSVTLGGGSTFTIPSTAFTGNQYGVINFTAVYGPAAPEEDTMATVLNVLIKVFGAIIGILFYGGNTEAGVAMMEKVLGGLDL